MKRRKFIGSISFLTMSPIFAHFSMSNTVSCKVIDLPPFITHIRHSGFSACDQKQALLDSSIQLTRERFFKNGYSSSTDDLKSYSIKTIAQDYHFIVSNDGVKDISDSNFNDKTVQLK